MRFATEAFLSGDVERFPQLLNISCPLALASRYYHDHGLMFALRTELTDTHHRILQRERIIRWLE